MNLKGKLLRSQEKLKRIRSPPLVIDQFMETINQNNGIVGSIARSDYYVRILNTINWDQLNPWHSWLCNVIHKRLLWCCRMRLILLSQSEKSNATYSVATKVHTNALKYIEYTISEIFEEINSAIFDELYRRNGEFHISCISYDVSFYDWFQLVIP
ncbi:hypothetical protein LXL04_028024 [Taraxacum kok-saghyz]